MTSRILFVCAQNICRSAYLAAIVGSAAEADGADHIVSSRGARATAGLPMCEIAQSRLPAAATARGAAHRSRPLLRADIERADLILTATSVERSAVALLEPTSRSRSFTVREFIALAVPQGVGVAGGRSLAELASTTHSRRGSVAVVSSRSSFTRRRSESGYDIPDSHRESPFAHRRLFSALDADSAALRRALAE